MNSQSSRSHSVFTIRLRQRTNNDDHHRTSSVHLIDLAGSERTKRSGAVGQRMKEGQSINTSLSVLGQVISKLSSSNKGNDTHIPFRQSKLTYLLTDALTGNSYTWMLAAISPARHDQDETLSTLRFASSVKRIKTVPIRAPTPETRPVIPAYIVNNNNSYKSGSWKTRCSGVSPKGKLSSRQRRRLKLREGHKGSIGHSERKEAIDDEEEVELSAQSYMEDSLDDWDAKLRASSKLLKELHMDNIHEIAGRKTKEPYILNISDDPSLSGCLVYFLNSDKGSCRTTTVGSASDNDIVLVGLGIPDKLCTLSVKYDNSDDEIGKVEVKRTAADSTGRLIVGGHLLDTVGQVNRLNSGDRIIFGRAFVFRLVIPGSSIITAAAVSSSQRMSITANNMPIIEEEEIHQVMVESSMADTQTRKMASEVRAINRLLDSIGVSDVTEERGRFIEMYSGTLTRVQEANDILSELRSNSGITLNLVVLTDVSQMSEVDERRRRLTDSRRTAAAASPPPGMADYSLMFSIIFPLASFLYLVTVPVNAGSAVMIAEKLLGNDDGYCQRVCDERPGCIFSYCGDDKKCHNLASTETQEVVSCGAVVSTFDSCNAACDSVADCSGSTWKSFCKSWLDKPVCFGLLVTSKGLCYEASPGCSGTPLNCP
ncbi:hypothetical protein FOL47_005790 [Perkinsus chesapeaki]|uniref:Kinesin-like protein n=1 Tax=Perkinsus chesapeaki TaxID=330153 RepID=A0A7J6MZ68_PERCH|nr:hypothetical protein FOL47_005790 [Perkinsus chesapeaki]